LFINFLRNYGKSFLSSLMIAQNGKNASLQKKSHSGHGMILILILSLLKIRILCKMKQ